MIKSPLIQKSSNQIDTFSQPYNPKHTIIAIVSLLSLFFIVIITVAILQPLLNHTSIAPLSSNTSSSLDSFALSKLDSAVKTHVASAYGLSEEQINNLSIVIRENTIEPKSNESDDKTLTFIADVNNPKVTYKIIFHPSSGSATLSCPPITLVQNPDVYCYGSDGRSTITENLSQYLPYQGTTPNEIEFSISHHYDDLTSDPYLTIYASVCDDEALAQEVETEVKNWIKSKGIQNPDIIPLHFPHSYCND